MESLNKAETANTFALKYNIFFKYIRTRLKYTFSYVSYDLQSEKNNSLLHCVKIIQVLT